MGGPGLVARFVSPGVGFLSGQRRWMALWRAATVTLVVRGRLVGSGLRCPRRIQDRIVAGARPVMSAAWVRVRRWFGVDAVELLELVVGHGSLSDGGSASGRAE